MTVYGIPVTTLAGEAGCLDEHAGKVLLIVNVASRCGLTPQYAQLEALHLDLGARGFAVLAFPCNQFNGQEPGTADEILAFCSTTYGVTFPVYAKTDVNGPLRHPLFEVLTRIPDAAGVAGDITWNFEKFLVDRSGHPVARFGPRTPPDDPILVESILTALAAPQPG